MSEIVKVATSLRSDEVALVNQMAKHLDTSRAGVLRAMARFAMDHQDEFNMATRPQDSEEGTLPHSQAFDLAAERLAYEVRLARLDLPREYVVWRCAAAAYDGPDATGPTFSPEAHQYADACLAAIGERRPLPAPLELEEPEYDWIEDPALRYRELAKFLLVLAAALTLAAILAGLYAL